MIAQCRSSNIGLTLSTQSFSDLKNDEMDIVTQIIQNTNTKIILRQNDADSAELVAKLAGTETVKFSTHQYETSFLFGRLLTGLGTIKNEEQFVVHPNNIKRLKTGQAVVIHKGEGSIVKFKRLKPIKVFYSWEEWAKQNLITRIDSTTNSHKASFFDQIQERIRQKQKTGIVRVNKGSSIDKVSTPKSGLEMLKKQSEMISKKSPTL